MKKRQFIIIPLTMLLFACGKNQPPNCSDQETVKLIKQIATTKLKKSNLNTNQNMSVKNIRTIDKNATTGTYSCAANFVLTFNGQVKELPITYTSELLDNKKEFYVTVYGF